MSGLTAASFAWHDGVLRIAASFGDMRIRWRPAPLAEERVPGTASWRPFWPEFRVLPGLPGVPAPLAVDIAPADASPAALAARDEAFAALCREIPGETAALAAPFCSRQWALLALVHNRPGVRDLAANNPVLAYCLANSDLFRGTRAEIAASQSAWHSHRRQREILGWLGFPAVEPMVRIVRRIPRELATPSALLRLRTATAADEGVVKLLLHVAAINHGVLELAGSARLARCVTGGLLLEVAEREGERFGSPTADHLSEALLLQQAMGEPPPARPFATVAQVERYADAVGARHREYLLREAAGQEAVARVRSAAQRRADARQAARDRAREAAARRTARNRVRDAAVRAEKERKAQERLNRPFPLPPYPGTADIVPLTCPRDLREEGDSQSNCVGTYSRRVFLGVIYVYRVLFPQRATLALCRHPGGAWRISELEAGYNSKVSASTRRHVADWLARQGRPAR